MQQNNAKLRRDARATKATDGRSLKESGPSAFLDQVLLRVTPKDLKKILSKQEEAVPDTKDASNVSEPGESITLLIAQNPEMNASTFFNLLKSKGYVITAPAKVESDSALANLPSLRAGVKESLGFRTRSFMESQVDVKPSAGGTTRYKVVLLEEGMGNFGASCYYSREALQSAIPIFEGRKIYADHPAESEAEERPERSVRDILGHFENIHVQESKAGQAWLCGDVVVMGGESYQWARELMEHAVQYAKKFPDKEFVGLSINASGDSEAMPIDDVIRRGVPEGAMPKIQEAKDAGITQLTYVKLFKEAVSCDLVTEAGAGGKILDLIEGNKAMSEKENQEGGPGSGRHAGGGMSAKDKATAKRQEKLHQSRMKQVAFHKKSDAIKKGLSIKKGNKAQDDWAAGTHAAKKAAGLTGKPKESHIEMLMNKNKSESEESMDKEKEAMEAALEADQKEADAITGDDQSKDVHADAAQDEELIKKMIAKYMGDGEVSSEEAAIVKEAYEAHKEMGLEAEEAGAKACEYLKASKHMAAKREAAAAKEASAGSEDGQDDEKDEQDKQEESCGKESSVKESAQKSEIEKLREENAKLKGETAAFKEAQRKGALASHIEKVCKESKLHNTVTADFKKLVESAKSVEEVDKAWKIFHEGYRARKAGSEGLDFSGMVVDVEKTSFTESVGGGINFGSCVIED